MPASCREKQSALKLFLVTSFMAFNPKTLGRPGARAGGRAGREGGAGVHRGRGVEPGAGAETLKPCVGLARAQAGVQGAKEVPVYIVDEEWSPALVLKKASNLGLGGWWLGGTHMKPNPGFAGAVQQQVPKDAKVIVTCQKGLRCAPGCVWRRCIHEQAAGSQERQGHCHLPGGPAVRPRLCKRWCP